MSRHQLLRSMSAEEMTEWEEFYRIEPFGEVREDLRAGSIASPLYNCWTGAKTKPSDWLLRERRAQTPEEMKAVCMAIVAMAKRGCFDTTVPVQRKKVSKANGKLTPGEKSS